MCLRRRRPSVSIAGAYAGHRRLAHELRMGGAILIRPSSHSVKAWNANSVDRTNQTEHPQQPNQYDYKYDDIEQTFDRARHRDVGIDEPEDETDHDQNYDDAY
jgi:hypothetical protein